MVGAQSVGMARARHTHAYAEMALSTTMQGFIRHFEWTMITMEEYDNYQLRAMHSQYQSRVYILCNAIKARGHLKISTHRMG